VKSCVPGGKERKRRKLEAGGGLLTPSRFSRLVEREGERCPISLRCGTISGGERKKPACEQSCHWLACEKKGRAGNRIFTSCEREGGSKRVAFLLLKKKGRRKSSRFGKRERVLIFFSEWEEKGKAMPSTERGKGHEPRALLF